MANEKTLKTLNELVEMQDRAIQALQQALNLLNIWRMEIGKPQQLPGLQGVSSAPPYSIPVPWNQKSYDTYVSGSWGGGSQLAQGGSLGLNKANTVQYNSLGIAYDAVLNKLAMVPKAEGQENTLDGSEFQ